MKRSTFMMFFIISFFSPSYAMNNPQQSGKQEETDMFAEFEGRYFAGDQNLATFFGTYRGREHILRARVVEIVKADSIASGLAQQAKGDSEITALAKKVKPVSTSLFYNPKQEANFFVDSNILSIFEPDKPGMLLFLKNLANTERALETITKEEFTMDMFQMVTLLEKTRRLDLYLLKTILEKDNTRSVQDVDLGTCVTLLQHNHAQWPPEHLKPIVHHALACSVVKAALVQRANNKTDEIKESDWKETWQHLIRRKVQHKRTQKSKKRKISAN